MVDNMRSKWMIKMFVVAACIFLYSLAYAARVGPAVPFAADYILLDYFGTGDEEIISSGKYYASPEGIRVEELHLEDRVTMVVNFRKGMLWRVMESLQSYVGVSFDPQEPMTMEDDPFGGFAFGEPCPVQGAKPVRLGQESLHGRNVEKWLCEIPGEDTVTVWYDSRLQAVVRSEQDEYVFELRNIKEGPLSSDLFAPPAGYSEMR